MLLKNSCFCTTHKPSVRTSQSQSYIMTDGQSASLSWNNASIWGLRPVFITIKQLRVCLYGALSLTRGRVCRLHLFLALVSAVIFGSEFRGTRDHILLSQIRDFPFRRLLRIAGAWDPLYIASGLPPRKTLLSLFLRFNSLRSNESDTGQRKHVYSLVRAHFRWNVFKEPLRTNELFRLSGVMSHYYFILKYSLSLGLFLRRNSHELFLKLKSWPGTFLNLFSQNNRQIHQNGQ
jgi:hypothetical protein